MPENVNGVATTTAIPNYSGVLYRRGNAETPLLSIIGGRSRTSKSYRFVTGQEYTLPEAEIPNISERQSLNAPEPTSTPRAQNYNVTQIFQDSVGVSYLKESSPGALSGVNNAGQTANPVNELDFQIATKMRKMGTDIEKTFIQGVYHEAANDNDVNRTCGLVSAITSNVFDINDKELSMWDLAEMLVAMQESGAIVDGLVLWCDSVTQFQLCKEAEANSIRPIDYDVNGIKITRIMTPLGNIDLRVGRYLPVGTALVLNLNVIAPVEQVTPGKGNFFYEELAKTGAGVKGQLFGVIGLDYGPEFYHGKITGIKASFTRPKAGVTVNVSGVVPTVETLPELSDVNITDAHVNSVSFKTDYVGVPTSTPTETAEYLVGKTPVGPFSKVAALDSSMVGQYVKVRVTASSTATGTVESGSKKLLPAVATISNVAVSAALSAGLSAVPVTVTLSAPISEGSVEVSVSDDGAVCGTATVNANGSATVQAVVGTSELSSGDALTVTATGIGAIAGTATTTASVS